jgi:hypothetical protein
MHAARVTRRAERESDGWKKFGFTPHGSQSNAHPQTNIPKLRGAFLEYIIYSIFNKRRRRVSSSEISLFIKKIQLLFPYFFERKFHFNKI